MHDLRGEWIFFQTDFLQLFHEIISNSLVNYNKEHAATVGLIRSIVSQFFAALHLNPLLSVESLIRFDSHHTKEAILNNYEIPKVTEGAQDQEDGGFERQVIPWNKEEDMILVENYDFFREDKDPFIGLANLLRDQAFFRDVRDVKLRCKLLKVDASIDIARQLVEKTHTKKLSVETVATRVLLFTFAKGRDLESQLISFLKDIGDRYALHESIYPVAMNLQYPVLPTEDWEFEILDWPVIGSTMEYLGCERPTIGKVWWRASGGSQATKNKINELHQEIVRLGRMSERQLLDMAEGQDDAEGFRRAARVENKAIEKKDRKSNKVSRKQASRDEKRRQIEEQNKINRELAGLASDDDEQLDLADFDDDDESSDQLDYGRKAPQTDDEDEEMAPKRRKVVNKESIGNQQASEDRPVLDLRAELREATNNGHSSPSKDTDNNGGKKPKRLKKANQGQTEEGSEPQGTDIMNTESAV